MLKYEKCTRVPSFDNKNKFGVSDCRNKCRVCPPLIIKLGLECQIVVPPQLSLVPSSDEKNLVLSVRLSQQVSLVPSCDEKNLVRSVRLSQQLSLVPSSDNTIRLGVSDGRNNCRVCQALIIQ